MRFNKKYIYSSQRQTEMNTNRRGTRVFKVGEDWGELKSSYGDFL